MNIFYSLFKLINRYSIKISVEVLLTYKQNATNIETSYFFFASRIDSSKVFLEYINTLYILHSWHLESHSDSEFSNRNTIVRYKID